MQSTSGLPAKDEKALALLLRQLESITPGRAYLGGGEWLAIEKMQADVRRRLEPETVESLMERAAAIIEPLRQHERLAQLLSEAER